MLTEKFLMGRGRRYLTADDLAALEAAVERVVELPPRHTLTRRGEPVANSTLLLEGVLCRYMDDRDGDRQLVAVQIAGDFVDLHAFPMKHLDHDIATIGPATVALVPHDRLETLVLERSSLARMFWFSTLLDAAMHREWIFRLGRLDARGRVAHFFCELFERLTMVELAEDGRFGLPLTQADLGEACGMTPVHANRVLRGLREHGVITFRDGVVTIDDREELRRLAEFDPAYLYPGGPDG
ncbi:MAG: Crp/Fnr family transcriptional regulator [Sphingomonadaceae bacterium]|nr:Crp/Fnr family transcriptional regulator [Sphingomonadaceae bacterium]